MTNDFKFYEVECKEDLLNCNIYQVAKSLWLLHGTDLENALIASYFINNKSKPDIISLKCEMANIYKDIDELFLISEELLKELIIIKNTNQLTNYEQNFSLL